MKKATLPKLKKKAQIVFNAYIRKRDEALPCISCGEFKESYQAGHFYAVGGYDGLRFNEDNCHKECTHDNCFNESHLIGYGENLRQRIGEIAYAALRIEAEKYKKFGHKWTRSELEEIIDVYTEKIKNL